MMIKKNEIIINIRLCVTERNRLMLMFSYYDVLFFCVNRFGNLKLHIEFFFLKIVLLPLRDRERKNITGKDFWLGNKLLCVSFENKND